MIAGWVGGLEKLERYELRCFRCVVCLFRWGSARGSCPLSGRSIFGHYFRWAIAFSIVLMKIHA
jgi:hypothetical protein